MMKMLTARHSTMLKGSMELHSAIPKTWTVLNNQIFICYDRIHVELLGVPLDGAALLRSAVKLKTSSPARSFNISKSNKYDADVDGTPSESYLQRRVQYVSKC